MIARARLAIGLVALVAGRMGQAEPALPPPYAGAYQPQGVDEQGLWALMDEEERRFAQSDMVMREAALQAYVTKVLCDTVGADRCGATRVYIVRVPVFNASMSPNGLMQVYSGLLLRVHSEAELGAVLGHEFGHFEARHSLEQLKTQRSSGDVMAWAFVLANMAPSYDVVRAYRNLQLTIIGNFYRFGRNQEREADGLGIGYLNSSALRPQAAAQVWERLMSEFTADARAKGLKKPRFDRIPFYATHPPEAERAATLTLLARPDAATRDDGAARYRAALAPWLPQLLEDQIKLNDFGASEFIISRSRRAAGPRRSGMHAASFTGCAARPAIWSMPRSSMRRRSRWMIPMPRRIVASACRCSSPGRPPPASRRCAAIWRSSLMRPTRS